MKNVGIKTLEQWKEAEKQMKFWKDKESKLRKFICHKLLDGESVGTHNFPIGHFKVKAVKKVTHNLDQKEVTRMVEEGDLTAAEEDVIKATYKLALTAYKNANPADMDRINGLLTVTEGMPTLSVEEA